VCCAHPHPFTKRMAAGAVATLAIMTLAACGAGAAAPEQRRMRPVPVRLRPAGSGSHPVTGEPVPTALGWDNDGQPCANFKVTLKVSPHLESVDFDGGPYRPSTPLHRDGTCYSGDGYCDPAGYQFIHFTLSISNRTASPEGFGSVGFASVEQPIVYCSQY
jgi:hypothetical protein